VWCAVLYVILVVYSVGEVVRVYVYLYSMCEGWMKGKCYFCNMASILISLFVSILLSVIWVISISKENMTKEDRDNIEFPWHNFTEFIWHNVLSVYWRCYFLLNNIKWWVFLLALSQSNILWNACYH